MTEFLAGQFDIAVIGAGHAGIEAALAAARLGMEAIVFTINLDAVGNMPCNPAIGGTGKGHLVRELDALGGEMAKAADACCIQYRLLNKGKGPAVWSLRAQADRRRYQEYMKHTLEQQDHLTVRQGEVVEVRTENGAVSAVVLATGAVFSVKAVILATGTYLAGRTIVGECVEESGPDGMHAAGRLTDSLLKLGLPLRRFKTGTPPRVNARSVDFDEMELQPGDALPVPFSYGTQSPPENRAVCWLTWTTEETLRIVRENLDRAPMYSGVIEGVGPRYCPSFETKVVRFPDKLRHQLFVEPMGLNTEELYIQGFSSSMPEEVQIRMLRSVPGLRHAVMTRPAYAIEYDCIDPLALRPTLECKAVPGLYGAGQFNGSSGYEEAAVQGFAAGVNAVRKLRGECDFILSRSESYIGTLIDDLVTKGTNEPYRMMTSRSEYRLLLRQDNADQRLTRRGYDIGLVPEARLRAVEAKYDAVAREIARLTHTGVSPSPALASFLAEKGTADAPDGCPLVALLRRPQLTYADLAPFDPDRPDLRADVAEQVEISVKYEGYIQRQQKQVEDFRKMERRRLPPDLDYSSIQGLRLEAREKLNAVRPADLGQASRISGVSPADVTALMIYLEPLLHSQGQAQLEASGKGRGTPLETQARHLVEQAEADVLRRGGQHLLQHMVLEERLLAQRRLCVLVIEPFVNFFHKRPPFTILYIVFIVTRDLVSVNRKGPLYGCDSAYFFPAPEAAAQGPQDHAEGDGRAAWKNRAPLSGNRGRMHQRPRHTADLFGRIFSNKRGLPAGPLGPAVTRSPRT